MAIDSISRQSTLEQSTHAQQAPPVVVSRAAAQRSAELASANDYVDSYESVQSETQNLGAGESDEAVILSDDKNSDSHETTNDEHTASEQTSADKDQHKPANELTPSEVRVVAELRARDREVRSHEAAHQAAGGGTVGGASYTYQQGPDGHQYAIGGEVSVNLSTSGSSPEAIIAKMAQVRAAALAPADPSPQDHSVAASATAIASQARDALRAEERQATEDREAQAEAKKEESPTSAETAAVEEDTIEPIDLLGPDLRQTRAVAAYQQSQNGHYQTGVNLVG